MGKIITVNFRGDELYGFENDEGVFMALKPMVEAMGLQWNAQRERLNRDPILSKGTRVMRVPFGNGGAQETTCLKFDLVNGWLFTIDSNRIKDAEVRQRVLTYQEECYGVLHKHFYRGERDDQLVIEDHEQAHEPETGKLRMVTEARQTFGHKAAAQLWVKFGLPMVPAMIEENRQFSLLDFESVRPATPRGDTQAA